MESCGPCRRKRRHKKKEHLTIKLQPLYNKGCSLKFNKIDKPIPKQFTYNFPSLLFPEGDIVLLDGFPHKVKKIRWEKKGGYVRYKVPKYRVEFINARRARRWFQEYELQNSLPFEQQAEKPVTDSEDNNADKYNRNENRCTCNFTINVIFH